MIKWLETFLEEKGIDLDTEIVVQGEVYGDNYMTVEVIVEHIKIAPKHEQDAIKNTLIKIDFHNGDVMHFFNHLAKAIAV